MYRTHLKAAERPDVRTDTESSAHVSSLLGMVEAYGEEAIRTLAPEYDG